MISFSTSDNDSGYGSPVQSPAIMKANKSGLVSSTPARAASKANQRTLAWSLDGLITAEAWSADCKKSVLLAMENVCHSLPASVSGPVTPAKGRYISPYTPPQLALKRRVGHVFPKMHLGIPFRLGNRGVGAGTSSGSDLELSALCRPILEPSALTSVSGPVTPAKGRYTSRRALPPQWTVTRRVKFTSHNAQPVPFNLGGRVVDADLVLGRVAVKEAHVEAGMPATPCKGQVARVFDPSRALAMKGHVEDDNEHSDSTMNESESMNKD